MGEVACSSHSGLSANGQTRSGVMNRRIDAGSGQPWYPISLAKCATASV